MKVTRQDGIIVLTMQKLVDEWHSVHLEQLLPLSSLHDRMQSQKRKVKQQ